MIIFLLGKTHNSIKQPQDQLQFQTIYKRVQWTSWTYGRISLIRSFFLCSNGTQPRQCKTVDARQTHSDSNQQSFLRIRVYFVPTDILLPKFNMSTKLLDSFYFLFVKNLPCYDIPAITYCIPCDISFAKGTPRSIQGRLKEQFP